jgi:hypothetical protein
MIEIKYEEKLDNNKTVHEVDFIVKPINRINEYVSLKIDEYKTITPIPYEILEQELKNLISNWNQKQKENEISERT